MFTFFTKRSSAEAVAAYQNGDYARAKKIAAAVLKKMPADEMALSVLGNVFFVEQNYAEAVEYYQRILQINAVNQEAVINLAEALLRQKKYAAALSVAAHIQDEIIAELMRSKVAFEQENFAAAEAGFVAYLNVYKTDFWVWNLLSQAAQKNARFKLALDAAWQAVELSNGADSQHLNMAYSLYEIALEKDTNFVLPWLQKWHRKYAADGIVKQSWNAFFPSANFCKADSFYVRQVFDNFADSFEETLSELEYKVPQKIADILSRDNKNLPPKLRILDAGCGTGLVAQKLDSVFPRKQIFGVDISEQMLQKAATKKLYKKLCCADLESYLPRHQNSFDLIVAADVFTYFGALEKLVKMCFDSLSAHGVLVFSASAAPNLKTEWRQHLSGRFLHSRKYLQKCLSAAGFSNLKFTSCTLRKEAEIDVRGWIIRAEK